MTDREVLRNYLAIRTHERDEARLALEAGKIQWAAVKANADKACAENERLRAELESARKIVALIDEHCRLSECGMLQNFGREGGPMCRCRLCGLGRAALKHLAVWPAKEGTT